MSNEYTAARTPNPCVACNNWIKFGRLFDYADRVGAEYVATGHYARLVRGEGGGAELHQGVDLDKDQSYVLFGIEPHRLARILLPVGGFCKPDIRAHAATLGLDVAEKQDSQEICFVTQGHHADFVRQRGRGGVAGAIITADGREVGRHQGIEAFTVGQRKGLGVAMGEPYFVVRIDPQTHQVVIGRREELARTELIAKDCNWLAEPDSDEFACLAKIRYNSPPAAARGSRLADGRLRVVFDEPLFGVSPGQAVVCYSGTRVLGGGWIESCESP